MSARGRLIAVIVIVVIVNLAFFIVAVRGKQSDVSAIKDDISAEESRTLELQGQLTRLKELQDTAPKLEAELNEIREQVPQEAEVPNFIFLVQEAGDEAGVGFVQISPELPKPPPEGAPVAEVRTVIAARGGYFAIQDFIRRLYDLDRALRIDLLTMSGQQEEGAPNTEITLNITARIFFELPGGASSAPSSSTSSAPAPPVATPSASPSPEE